MKKNLTKKHKKHKKHIKGVKTHKIVKFYKNKFMKNTKKKLQKSSKKKGKKNKSRKTKKGGLRTIEEGKFTKKDYRVKAKLDYYKTMQINSCDNISNYNDLINKLETNFVKKNNLSIYNNTFTLFPYCNENIKGPSVSLDKVNKPYTSTEGLQAFNKVFQAYFKAIQPATITENGAQSTENNPESFINLLKTMPNNIFVVSHSGIMSKMYDYILKDEFKSFIKNQDKDISSFASENTNVDELDKLFMDQSIIGGGMLSKIGLKSKEVREYGVFDNLDILQLIFDKETNNITYMIIRRYTNNYKVQNEISFNEKTSKSVFIMRHCLGCHNITPGISVKAEQAFKQITQGRNLGYLDWSMCFENTVDEMNSVSNNLYNILEKFGGMKSYIFGSSVIFRAILTSILMFNVLKSEEEAKSSIAEEDRPSIAEEDRPSIVEEDRHSIGEEILSRMKGPIDPESP